jgi:hypothetical protein
MLSQALLVIATFSAAHERAVEYVRHVAKRVGNLRLAGLIDEYTASGRNVIFGIALAVLTNADLLALFRVDAGHPMDSQFFAGYLRPFYWPAGTLRGLMGCVLMGMTVTLGAKFWHDIAYGLVDLRSGMKAVAAGDAKGVIALPATVLEQAPAPTPQVVTRA